MKPLADMLPVLVFFATYFGANTWHGAATQFATSWLSSMVRGGAIPQDLVSILLASAAAILVITVQMLEKLIRRRKIGPMQWLTFSIFLVFGGATIYFHDDTFIKWKPTVLYWAFAIALLVSERFAGRNLIHDLLEQTGVQLSTSQWQRLNVAWTLFFVLVGALNLFVAFHLSRNIWVSFKSFGLTGLTLAFALLQSVFLARHMAPDKQQAPSR